MIMSMPEHDFIVYSISAKERKSVELKYEQPPNLLELHSIFLGAYAEENIQAGQRYNITQEEKEAFLSLFSGKATNWDALFDFFVSGRVDSVLNFLSSKDFFDIVHALCEKQFIQVPFTDMFWTLRSMVLPLFLCIEQEIPEADLYHSVSTGYAGVLGALARYQCNKPLLLTEHGIYTREREEEIIKADWIKGYFKDIWIDYFDSLSQCTYKYADRVTTLFEGSRQIQIELGCPVDKTAVIANGIDINKFHIQNRQLKNTGIHIGAVVRVVPIKDIKTMIQSFAIVQQEVEDSHFYIIGPYEEDVEYYNECVEMVEDLGIRNLVFTGVVNVQEYLAFLDILVLSSISEGQPLVILEGLAMEIPFVATDVGSCTELLLGKHDEIGPAGVVVPVMHFHLMANEIIALAGNPERRREYGSNGRERVTSLYTLTGMIDKYHQLYREVNRNGRYRLPTKGTV
ncbi:glycosyltransferase involved in cell wall biosynthesis [Planomicrobium sp. HSC-17F08]|nr:glycosyltransferase involved in cell wall biosynthesis [Planomicrobium sp. HSC-17F08]